MTDYHDLLETIYGNVHKLFGLIRDHEQDLKIVDKANSLLVDTKTELLYLNDRIHSEITRSSSASASPPNLSVKCHQQQNFKQPVLTDDSDRDEVL